MLLDGVSRLLPSDIVPWAIWRRKIGMSVLDQGDGEGQFNTCFLGSSKTQSGNVSLFQEEISFYHVSVGIDVCCGMLGNAHI